MVTINEDGRRAWISGGKAESYCAPDNANPYKVYVEVLASFTREGFLRPLRVKWEDGRTYVVDRVLSCQRAASRKAGGMGIRYTCMICGREVELFYEENYKWFLCRR